MSSEEEAAGTATSIAAKAGRGLRWSLAATVATKVGSFAMGLVLARLLTPSDFGVYAIALAATGFLMHVNDVGLIAAVVQWRGRLSDIAPTATVMAFGTSILIYLVFFFGAPAFATLAGSPEAIPTVRLLTFTVVIDGITAIRVAALQRDFQQSKIAIANMAGFAVQAPVAIILAVGGAGAYSFVVGQLAQATVTGAIVFWSAHLPLRLALERTTAKALLRYGIPAAAGLGVEALLMNADYTVVGRLMGATALGYYLLAFNISSWVASTLGTAIRYVSVAGFARLSEQEDRLSGGVRKAVSVLVLTVLPVVTVMSVLAAPLVALLYGSQWAPAASALTFLMLFALIRLLTGLAVDVLMATGATRTALAANAMWAVALVPALVVGTLAGGIRGTAVSHVLTGGVIALPIFALALHRAGVHLRPIGRGLVRPLLAAMVAAGSTHLVSSAVSGHVLLQLLCGGTAGLAIYVTLALPPQTIRDQLVRFTTTVRTRSVGSTG